MRFLSPRAAVEVDALQAVSLGWPTSTKSAEEITALVDAAPTQRILVIAADPGVLDRLAAAVRRGGAEPVTISGPEQLDPGTIPFRFVVCATDADLEMLGRVTPRLRPGAQLVAMAPPVKLAVMTRILADERCNHVIADDEAGLHTLAVTISKFVTGDLFGIEKYIPEGTEIHLTRLRDYQGRTKAIDEVLGAAEKLGVRSKVRNQIGQVCEELLMNALYDAPIDDEGNLLFGDVDLKARLGQLSPRPVSIRYAATETGFAISVRDRFGRLDKATILRYLDKCLHSPTQIDRKIYGAGLGLYLVANAATQYVVNVAPGMATEVVCTFDRRGARTGLRVLSIFVYPGLPVAAQQQG